MPNGIIIIDKPTGWTSMDICAKLRGVFRERRIGHAGTLDPMATGVLPVFVGRATRAVEFAAVSDKTYVAGLRLGVITNTQDVTGEVLETRPVRTGRAELEAALAAFRGDILQIPPMYSAIKRDGKKLYELARKGVEVERPPRPVTIRALALLPLEEARAEGLSQEAGDVFLRITCSKGTYVRTLCHDIGQALGCGGCMSALRRTWACGFSSAAAHGLEEAVQAADPAALLLPVDTCFQDRPAVALPPEGERRIRNGGAASSPGLPDGEYRVYGGGGAFLALGRAGGGLLTAIKSFFEV